MPRTSRLPIAILLTALLAWAGSACHQVGPAPMAPTGPAAVLLRPQPTPPVPALPVPGPAMPAPPVPVLATSLPGAAPTLPGGRVTWTAAPQLRGAPRGLGTFLTDVESHLPPEMGMQYRDRDHVTWCHETTHGIHAGLRNRYGRPAFYPGGGKCALVEAPALTLGEVAAVVPQRLRGTRFNLYLVAARRDWERDPLYVWDEWVAYDNGTTTGIAQGGRSGPGASDDAVACIEFSGYALAVAAAARRKGAPVSEQFREFLAWELRRSLGLYARALALPGFAWPDRRLEQMWRGGDAFVAEELRALYGEGLTVRDLLR